MIPAAEKTRGVLDLATAAPEWTPGVECPTAEAASKERGEDSPGWSDPRSPANAATASKIRVETALSRIVTTQTILTTHYPEPRWAVKGLIPEGVTFVAVPPKLGKSIFALNLAASAAEGRKALLSCATACHLTSPTPIAGIDTCNPARRLRLSILHDRQIVDI
jgi:hypothetical protein